MTETINNLALRYCYEVAKVSPRKLVSRIHFVESKHHIALHPPPADLLLVSKYTTCARVGLKLRALRCNNTKISSRVNEVR